MYIVTKSLTFPMDFNGCFDFHDTLIKNVRIEISIASATLTEEGRVLNLFKLEDFLREQYTVKPLKESLEKPVSSENLAEALYFDIQGFCNTKRSGQGVAVLEVVVWIQDDSSAIYRPDQQGFGATDGF